MNKIAEKELEEILARLEEAGWQPQLCDTPLPAYECTAEPTLLCTR